MERPSDQIREQDVPSERRVWRLRPLYIGGTGIVAGRIVDWTGSSELTIGRYEGPNSASRCMSVDDGRVSRRHARLFTTGGRTFIEDLRSRNGTALNGEVLRPGEPRAIVNRKEILGDFVPRGAGRRALARQGFVGFSKLPQRRFTVRNNGFSCRITNLNAVTRGE